MGRTKKVAFTLVTENGEQEFFGSEKNLFMRLSEFEDIAGLKLFAGAPIAINRKINVELSLGGKAVQAKPGKRRGRPPGTKNTEVRRGRPPGSKNAKKTKAKSTGTKRRGRPPKAAAAAPATVANILVEAVAPITPVVTP